MTALLKRLKAFLRQKAQLQLNTKIFHFIAAQLTLLLGIYVYPKNDSQLQALQNWLEIAQSQLNQLFHSKWCVIYSLD